MSLYLYYVVKIIRPKHVIAIHADYGQRMMEMERLGVTRNVDRLRKQGYNVELKTVDIQWLGQTLYFQARAFRSTTSDTGKFFAKPRRRS